MYVLPSVFDDNGDAEGLGVTTIEAFLNECPVVATDVGGIVDVVHHERTGLLVPEKNPEAIASAVIRYLDDKMFAHRMGVAGKQFALEHFNWDRITRKIQSIYAMANRVESMAAMKDEDPSPTRRGRNAQ